MTLRCPYCHAHATPEAFTEDAAARELLGLIAQRRTTPPSLMAYLTLFRTGKRDLTYVRSLTLAHEAMELTADMAQLEHALAETVEALRQKRDEGQGKPLKGHNYLKRVLESTPAAVATTALTTSESDSTRPAARSKTASAIGRLETWKRG
jgi:hypothetical protein